MLDAVRELTDAEGIIVRVQSDESRIWELASPPQADISSKIAPWIQAHFDAQGPLQLVPLLEDQTSRQFWVAPLGGRGDKGWIAVSVSEGNFLSEQQKLQFLAVAQRLTELCEISELRNSISQRDQFLSIASHELKTPLTAIYGLLQLQSRMLKKNQGAAVGPAGVEKQAEFLKIVTRQSERLNELIDGLLDVSRIQNGRFSVEPSQVELTGIVRETLGHRLKAISDEAGVTIQTDLPEKLDAWVDPVRFEEVISNLGMNAIRFSPEGGVVWIRLVAEGQDGVRVSFRDQGPSVPEADRLRIFQPFEKAQRTTRLGGLGLGLYISRQIAQLHGGDVRLAESLPGRGNLFVAEFPGRMSSQGGGNGLTLVPSISAIGKTA